jgi:head-tail adaptor
MANDPQVGEMDKRVRIRAWQDVPDAGFGIEQTFDEGREVWAKVLPVGSAVFLGSMQVDSSITHQAFVRYSPEVNERTVTAAHVVELGLDRYRVKRANAYKGQKNFLFIELELLGAIAT